MSDNCDWKENKKFILETLTRLENAIKELHAELSDMHLEMSKMRLEMSRMSNDKWPPWKYILLGAVICVPQIGIEIIKSLL